MASTYSMYSGSLRPESSLPTIDEGVSHLGEREGDGNGDAAAPATPPIVSQSRSPRYSKISLNLLPPGHQSPTARVVSSSSTASGTSGTSTAAHSSSSNSGIAPRSRHGTAGSSNTTVSLLSLNESELFRGAQNALAHLDMPQSSGNDKYDTDPTATSIALSQHYQRHAQLDAEEETAQRIEDENMTGISQLTKTPMPAARYRQQGVVPDSPSLPSSLRQVLATTATPRSKSVTFASPQPEDADVSAEDDMSASERAMLSEWTQRPPSESSPPSRSLARSSPRRSPSPLEHDDDHATSPPHQPSSPSPVSRASPGSVASTSLRPGRLSGSPSAHTSVAHTPSRLRNVVTITDTESSVDSVLTTDKSLEQSPSSTRPPSRHEQASPPRFSVAKTPVALSPLRPSGEQAQELAVSASSTAQSPATATGTGTFATADSFQNTPSALAKTQTSSSESNESDSKAPGEVVASARYPSFFANASILNTTDNKGTPEPANTSSYAPGDDSLSRLTRAAQAISAATATAFTHLSQAVVPAIVNGADISADISADLSKESGHQVQELAHGADLVQEMHDLHAALQANLLRRLQAAEQEQVRERNEREQLEKNMRRLLVSLMGEQDSTNAADELSFLNTSVGMHGDGETLKSLFVRFRTWALNLDPARGRESLVDGAVSPKSFSRTNVDDEARMRALQSELERLEEEVEDASQARRQAQVRVVELETERDELQDERRVFEIELEKARTERSTVCSERDELADELALAHQKAIDLETQVAEQSAARSQAEAYRRRLEEEFEARTKELRREVEEAQRDLVRVEGEREVLQEEQRARDLDIKQVQHERDEQVAKLTVELETERQQRIELEQENTRLASLTVPDDVEVKQELSKAQAQINEQASRIKELEKQSANAELEVAKLLKVRDRMEQETANLAMGLAAKQQELSLLKRNTGRPSGNLAKVTATPKTPRASKSASRGTTDEEDVQTTVRRRPPTAVLQSLILNTETPLPSSRIANRAVNLKTQASESDSEPEKKAYRSDDVVDEESEGTDEVAPLRSDPRLRRRTMGLERTSAPLRSLSARTSLGSAAHAGQAQEADENQPPSRTATTATVSSAARSSQALNATSSIAARRARNSMGGVVSLNTGATRTVIVGSRSSSGRASLGGASSTTTARERISAATAARLARREREREGAVSPTPSAGSVASARSAASGYSSASTASTRTGVLRSASAAAAARKSGTASGSVSSTATTTSTVRDRATAVRPRVSGVGSTITSTTTNARRPSLSAGQTSSRPSLKRAEPDADPGTSTGRREPPSTLSNSAADAQASRPPSTDLMRSLPSLSLAGLSLSAGSGAGRASLASLSRDEEMTEAELSGHAGASFQAGGAARVGDGSGVGARAGYGGVLPARRLPSVPRTSFTARVSSGGSAIGGSGGARRVSLGVGANTSGSSGTTNRAPVIPGATKTLRRPSYGAAAAI